jgi:Type IV pili methyl-accepting chemotaxis transducer N-term
MKRYIHIFLFCASLFPAGLVFALLPLSVQAESSPATTNKIDIATAVNMAGRQRMLSQRMVKAYLMLGQNITPDDARNILQKSIDLFESQLTALKTLQPNQNVQTAIANLDAEWKIFRPLITTTPGKQGAATLYEANETLQKVAHTVTLAYDNVTIAPRVHLINLAGRQRMLTQRTAKFFLYRTWDLYSEAADMEMTLSRAHFTTVLLQLQESPYATTQIRELAVQIQRDWEPYQQALLASREPAKMRDNAQLVAKLSEQLLTSTEKLVALVVEQAQQQ